jgi:hypothetical protein
MAVKIVSFDGQNCRNRQNSELSLAIISHPTNSILTASLHWNVES